MRLHFHPMSPYSRKAWVALLHREDAFEEAPVKLGAGALRRPEFLAISPFGKMPVLETEDGPIFESTSIIEWLEARGPRVLLPEDRHEAFFARHYDRIADMYLMEPMAALWWEPRGDQARVAPGIVTTAWDVFAKRLEGRDFVCGEAFSLGDLGAAIATDYLVRLGIDPPTSIAPWLERCFCVPAMKDALDEARPAIDATLRRRAESLMS